MKSESVDTIVQPCSIATAGCCASATKLPNSPYVATKLLEDCRVVGTRADDASVRTIREFPREGEHLVDGRGSGKNATVGYDAGEPRQR